MKTVLSATKTLLVLLCLAGGLGWQPAVMGAPEAGAAGTETALTKLNINTATAEEIATALTGIGTKKAEAVVQYRELNGPFTSFEQLLEVKGIGEVTLEKNREKLTL